MELEFAKANELIANIPATGNLPDLFGRRIGYSNPQIPGFYHVHRLEDYGVVYMDEATCDEFNAKLEDIIALGPGFQPLVTHPEDLERVTASLETLKAKQDEEEILTYFQRIRLRAEGNDGFTLVVTSVRISLKDQTYICISNTTDQLPVLTQKICNALNRRYETRKYVKQYLTLTRREQEVFDLVIKGNTAKEMAESLVLSSRTIEQHKKNIYRKLAINSQAEAVSMAKVLRI